MQNKKLSIRKIVTYLNDDESEGGGFWLPNIQRPFVWSEDQIARLFDSIMREYPISTLLIWKTKDEVKHRKFIDNYHTDVKLTKFRVPDNKRSKLMVLDGQQRLQSLFIGLKGSYSGKELYLDVLSGDNVTAAEDIRYRFAFMNKENVSWPFVRFKDIVLQNKADHVLAVELAKKSANLLTEIEQNILLNNLYRIRQEFVNDDNIAYQELDGIEFPDTYKEDDIVEIFIRANSGGTKLGKSDLLFSLLISSWDDADGEIESLLEDINKSVFKFDRDFILKSCLAMLGKGASYDVRKFRDGKTKEDIIAKWTDLSNAIREVRDFLITKTYVRSDKSLPSYLALIPLIYYRYNYPDKFKNNTVMADYLLRSLATGVFGGSPDNLIDRINRCIDENKEFNLTEVYSVIRSVGRNLDLTPDVILGEHYGSKSIHLFFNMWYRDFNYTPALSANEPQVDHIFPQSLLKAVKDVNPEDGKRNKLRYRAEFRDQIANCMLLTAEENGFTGKSGAPPNSWFKPERFADDDAHKQYLEIHLIPSNPELWELNRFEDFIEARKKLIINKFSYMLQKTDGDSYVA